MFMSVGFSYLNPISVQEKNLQTVSCLNKADFFLSNSMPEGMKATKIVKNFFGVSEKTYEFRDGKYNEVDSIAFSPFKTSEHSATDVIKCNKKIFIVSSGFEKEKITLVVKKYFKLCYFEVKNKTQNTQDRLLGFHSIEPTTDLSFLYEKNGDFRLLNAFSIKGLIDETNLSLSQSTFAIDFLPTPSREEMFKTMGANPKFNTPLNENANSSTKTTKLEIPVNDQQKQIDHSPLIFVQCNAEPGSVLQLRGEGCSGLSWSDGIALTHIFGDLWALATDIDISQAKAKLVKVAPNGSVVWEKGENRTFTNDAIQACIPQIEGSELPSEGKQEVQKEPLIIKFKADSQDNGKLMLRGEGGGLTWHTGMPLISLGHDLWACEIASSGNAKIEFKIVKEYPDSKVHWETTANRSFTTGQKPVVLDAVNTTFAP